MIVSFALALHRMVIKVRIFLVGTVRPLNVLCQGWL